MKTKITSTLSPLIGLFRQDRADKSDDCVSVGKYFNTVGASVDFSVKPLLGAIGPDLLPPIFSGKRGQRERLPWRYQGGQQRRGVSRARNPRVDSIGSEHSPCMAGLNECSLAFTAGHIGFGVAGIRFAAHWVMQHCQDAPGKF